MAEIIVKNLVGQDGQSLGKYVDYADFLKMKNEYEEKIANLEKEKRKIYDKILDGIDNMFGHNSMMFSKIQDYFIDLKRYN